MSPASRPRTIGRLPRTLRRIEMASEPDLLEKVVALCKRRGFVFPTAEIYGGMSGCYDYGPVGAELRRQIRDDWWRAMVTRREDVVGLESSILMPAKVWEVSGHVAGFHDPLVDCKKCKGRFRADTLADARCPEKPSKRPGECGGELTEPRQFNMMFRTVAGPVEAEGATVYLRPETAQGIFVNFKNVLESTRVRVPFGIAQIGKAFRNEIVVRQFIFRLRELEQMECEFFCVPGTEEEWFSHWKAYRMKWWTDLGIRPSRLRLRPHEKEELAHYAKGCVDVEYRFPFGWKEIEGIASRSDFDLKAHQGGSGKGLSYLDEAKKEWVIPYVVEPSAGVDRCFLTILADAYEEETKANGEVRTVLHIHPKLAPTQVGIFPLVKRDGMPERGRAIFAQLSTVFRCLYDESATVGKRYARMDEVGTPYAITIDSQTLVDGTVTVRDRDSMDQIRVAETQLLTFLADRIRTWTRKDDGGVPDVPATTPA
jgi:glycyl-tRNA synthetase